MSGPALLCSSCWPSGSSWALDVHNGYRTLFHLFGISVFVLVCARVVAIVAFGALGRIFRTNAENEESKRSIVHRHAYRYYPFLRRAIRRRSS